MGSGKKIMMADIPWPEYQKRVAEEVVLLPVGTTEQHGYHMPLGVDAYQVEFLAQEVAKKIDAIVAPTVWYGYKSQPHSGGGQLFPTTGLNAQTLILLVRDILTEFIRHGARKIVILDGHYENAMMLTEAVDLALRASGRDDVRIIKSSFVNMIDQELTETLWPDGFPGWDLEHAGLLETSLMLYIKPEVVDMNKALKVEANLPRYEVFPQYEGLVPASGALADPTRATAEYGKMLVENIVMNYVKSIEEAFQLG